MTRALFKARRDAPISTPPPTLAIPGNQMIRYTNTQGLQSDMKTFAIVVLSPFETTDLGVLRAASPTTLALAYQDATVAKGTGDPTPSTNTYPLTITEAMNHDAAQPGSPGDAGRDEWLMYAAATGTTLVSVPSGDHLTNLGSATYQARVAARLQQVVNLGYDGIHYDNTNSKYTHRTTSGVQGWVTPSSGGARVQLSDATWKTNMTVFLSYQRSHVGCYLLANAGEQSDDTGATTSAWWDIIHPYLDGLQVEFFVMNGGNHLMSYNDLSSFMGHYNARLTMADTAYGHNKDFVAGASGNGATDLVKMTYQKASFLLKWNGTSGGAFYENITPSTSYIQDSFTTWIGTPVGAKYAAGTGGGGGWRRDYTHGTVIVNPNKAADGDLVFSLGGTYYDPSNNPQTSVTLTPVTAMILTTEPR